MASGNCATCSKSLDVSDNPLKCDLCGNQFHPKCCEISNTKLKSLNAIREMVTWMCPGCSKMNPIDKLNIIFQGQVALEKKVDALAKEVAALKMEKAKQPQNVPDIFREFE